MFNRIILSGLGIFFILLIPTNIIFSEPASTSFSEVDDGAQKPLGQQYRDWKDNIIQTEKEQGKFDVGARLELANWALEVNKNWLTPIALQDLREIIKHEPEQPLARQLLGFVKYQDCWVTPDEFNKIKEDESEKLLSQIKSSKEGEREELIKCFKEIDIAYKIRPLIKALQDSSENLQVFAIKEIQDSRETIAVPYLVRASLTAGKDSVRNKAVSAIKDLDVKESIPWYGYYINKTRNSFNELIRERAIQCLGDLGGGIETTNCLIWTMYSVLLDINFQVVTPNGPFPGLTSRRVQFTNPSASGSNPPISLMGSVVYELPDVNFMGIKTTFKSPAGGNISVDDPLTIALPGYNPQKNTSKTGLLEYQLELCGNALEKVTGQTFGTDYEKWRAWYNENNKVKK